MRSAVSRARVRAGGRRPGDALVPSSTGPCSRCAAVADPVALGPGDTLVTGDGAAHRVLGFQDDLGGVDGVWPGPPGAHEVAWTGLARESLRSTTVRNGAALGSKRGSRSRVTVPARPGGTWTDPQLLPPTFPRPVDGLYCGRSAG